MDYEDKEKLEKEKRDLEIKRDRLKTLRESLSKIKERYRHHVRKFVITISFMTIDSLI